MNVRFLSSVIISCLILTVCFPIFFSNIVKSAPSSNFKIEVLAGPQCSDGIDNDNDTLTDFPDDTDCTAAGDLYEGIQPTPSPSPSPTPTVTVSPTPTGISPIPTSTSIDTPTPLPSETVVTIVPTTSISFTGTAAPNSRINLLIDGQFAVSAQSGNDGNFILSLSNITAGSYLFGLITIDPNGGRSSLTTIAVKIVQGSLTNVSGIVLSPTIRRSSFRVIQGNNVTISGYTFPNTEISLSLKGSTSTVFKTSSNASGFYSYAFETASLEKGIYQIIVKAINNTMSLPENSSYFIEIVDPGHSNSAGSCGSEQLVDINCDNSIDLIDFSILIQYYKEKKYLKMLDFDGNNKIDLVDFSILAYFWSGK